MRILALFCALVLSANLVFGQIEPYDLSVEYLNNPVGIDTPSPRLSWKSKTSDPKKFQNVVQRAYRVLVASSADVLKQDLGDLWDTGMVESSQSLNVVYAGAPLDTSQRCFWKVCVWYANGKTGDDLNVGTWSPAASWIMGVMKPEDWKAKWIASNEKFRPNFDLEFAQWIWTGNATDLSVAPQGKTYFRTVWDKPIESLENIAIDGVKSRLTGAVLAITADDEYKVFINGKSVHQTWGHFNDWRWVRFVDIAPFLQKGRNVIGVEVTNKSQGPTGLLACLKVLGQVGENEDRSSHTVATNTNWTSSAEPTKGWNDDPNFESEKWKPAVEVGPIGCEPWGKIEQRFETKSPAFEKSFTVDKMVKTATLHITGVGFYEASLNGKKIGNKVLDPAQTRYDKRVLYSTYDLTDTLRLGENRLNVLVGHGWYDVRSVAVWNFDNAPWRDFPRMIAQLEIVYDDGSKQLVVSDDSWDQVESPIIFDCIRQGETDKSLTESKIIGKAAIVDGPKGKLVAEAIPPSVITEEWKPVKISEPKPGVYVVDTGQNMAGWLRLKIEGQKPDDFVKIKYAERLAKDGNIDMKPIDAHYRHHIPFMAGLGPDKEFQVDRFQGNGVYEPKFMYHGFQYVEITGLTKKPTTDTVTCCAVNNDFKSAGKFECSNELFNKIQKATLWSYRGNFVNGVPTDCPHREKNGWTGDAQLAVEQAQYNWENTACYEKWIHDLLDEQRPDGNLPGIVPTSGWGYQWGNGPAWDSALCIIPWTLYQYKGDKRILEESYDGMKKYVDYLTSRAKEDGLVYHGLSDWCPANTKTEAVVTSSVYYALDVYILIETAELLGKTDDLEKYAELFGKIESAYAKAFYMGDGVVANGSQTSQSFPLYYNMFLAKLDEANRQQVFQKLVEAVEKVDNHLDVGILGAKSLFHTLSRYGRTDLAMKILNQKTAPSYGHWFERGATTLWEDWGDGASRNHIMFGDISTWFYQTLGGIECRSAFKEIKFKPEYPNGIDWVKAEHDSPYGMVKTDWKRNGKKITLNVSVPVNTKAMYGDKELGSGEYSFETDAP